MFFLVWFQFINNNLYSYEIGQFPSEVLCEDAKRDRIFYALTVVGACIVFALGSSGLIWGAALLAKEVR
mgnify:CR=1 FL=1